MHLALLLIKQQCVKATPSALLVLDYVLTCVKISDTEARGDAYGRLIPRASVSEILTQVRLHSSLGNLSPVEYERQCAH